MKSIKIYLMILAVVFTACSEDIMDDINKNVNNATKVASRFILTDVMTSTSFSITGADYAFYSSIYMEYNVGIWGQMYNAEIRVSEPISSTTYNNIWNAQYRNLYQLKIVIDKCSAGGEEEGNTINLGIAQVLYAYNLAMLTDLMGDIPYTEAMQPGVIYQPKVDKQQDIYKEVMTMIDNAITNLSAASTYTNPMGTGGNQDLIYKADKAKWLKAAQGLKARYTMRLTLKEGAKYDKVIEYANASFASAAEEFKFTYNGTTSVNPYFRFFQNRDNFGVSASLKAKLDARNDPRAARYFKPYTANTPIEFAPNGSPEQVQKKYGLSGLTSITAPTHLMSYHELQFLKAEAYARMSPANLVSAQASLLEGVKAAFVKAGLTVVAADTYFTTSVLPLFVANPVKEILNQKYLALYDEEAIEAYSDYRRQKAIGDNSVVLTNPNQFPQRFTYGSSDVTTNPNVRTAYGDGSYVFTEKVWWAGGSR